MGKVLKLSAVAFVAYLGFNGTSISHFDMGHPDTGVYQGFYDFRYTGVVNTGKDGMPLLGQLSKDGRTLYFSMQSPRGDNSLYQMKRSRVGGDFENPSKLSGNINDGAYSILMPTVSADEKTMVFVSSTNGMQNGNDLFIATKDKDGKFTTIRSLDELNEAKASDSYPWLSPNGLHLYFTKQQGRSIKFFVAERKSGSEQFSDPHELGFTLPKNANNMSCFLSANELEIYALCADKIYHATRTSIKDGFGETDEIANAGTHGIMNSITMTPDAKELYVFNTVGPGNSQVLRFVNTGAEKTMLGGQGGK